MKRTEAVGSVDLARAHDQQDDERAGTDSHRLIDINDLWKFVQIRGYSYLPVHLHRKLELARIVGSRWLSGVGV